jgi:NAD+ diphosphatase
MCANNIIEKSSTEVILNTGTYTGTYLFQGSDLVVSGDIPDSRIDEGLPAELIHHTFNDTDIETFEAPAIDGPGKIFGAGLKPNVPLPALWRLVPVRQGLSQLAAGTTVDGSGPLGRMLRAYHIVQWRRDSVYCGSCGARNTDAGDELARYCPACGRREYPRISPAVITIIINGEGKALLAHNKKFADGVYSLIAGFNEAGESLESTVARETMEEVNLELKDITYIASQAWPFPNSLMLGFTARHAGGEIRPDGIEIEDAQWFSRDKLPKLPGNGSVSRYLINSWIEGRL